MPLQASSRRYSAVAVPLKLETLSKIMVRRGRRTSYNCTKSKRAYVAEVTKNMYFILPDSNKFLTKKHLAIKSLFRLAIDNS